MILTELEARGDKEKGIEGRQCRAVPLVLMPTASGPIMTGKQQATYVPAVCAASACMLWRWVPDEWKPGETHNKPTRGYCGAGGVPNGWV